MRANTLLYTLSGLTVVLFAGIGLITYSNDYQAAQATGKAQQLQAELSAAGLRAPSTEQLVNTLGADGGAVCLDPDDALRRGILHGQLTNGAGGPGQRPVIADNKVVQGQLLIIKVYCPVYLESFQDVVDDLKLEDVA
ncbi:hypothetical protein [Actinoplanes xinjiangensis]|uniref:DUF732 domain-containing protein n=1 Tax=Actinoplanes xinjiangensis TaxID=512350 RepID=A0A316FA91_9ACTN|nr:hypothetical protein [Actinoplanes xinjiangensis]PWK45248.1 hypothetical protein BC793_111222 [Actinoplanes xinjiangensis]GIF41417.1 hypothetical protein Axi01nite_57280 [Actinoplanes xinjiangensis]